MLGDMLSSNVKFNQKLIDSTKKKSKSQVEEAFKSRASPNDDPDLQKKSEFKDVPEDKSKSKPKDVTKSSSELEDLAKGGAIPKKKKVVEEKKDSATPKDSNTNKLKVRSDQRYIFFSNIFFSTTSG